MLRTRSDSPKQKSAVIGDLNLPGYTLFHFYRDLVPAREALLAPGEKNGVCLSCDVSDDGPDQLARRKWIARTLALIPGVQKGIERIYSHWRARRRHGLQT